MAETIEDRINWAMIRYGVRSELLVPLLDDFLQAILEKDEDKLNNSYIAIISYIDRQRFDATEFSLHQIERLQHFVARNSERHHETCHCGTPFNVPCDACGAGL